MDTDDVFADLFRRCVDDDIGFVFSIDCKPYDQFMSFGDYSSVGLYYNRFGGAVFHLNFDGVVEEHLLCTDDNIAGMAGRIWMWFSEQY